MTEGQVKLHIGFSESQLSNGQIHQPDFHQEVIYRAKLENIILRGPASPSCGEIGEISELDGIGISTCMENSNNTTVIYGDCCYKREYVDYYVMQRASKNAPRLD